MVYTAHDAVWGFPEIKLGCYPPVAAVALPALIGQKQRAEMILTGRQISATKRLPSGWPPVQRRAEELENGWLQESLTELAN